MVEAGPLGQLLCRTPEGWSPLPDWARFMVGIGARVSSFDAARGRLVVALALPTRAFAAALAGVAAVVSSFEHDPPGADRSAHFHYLASLAPGTPVTLQERNSIVQGRLLGAANDKYDGLPRVTIQLPKEIRHLAANTCGKVQVIDDAGVLKTRQRRLVRAPRFLSSALPGLDATKLSAITRLDCVIIGAKNVLQYELTTELFAAGPAPQPHEGTLQGIVRAHQFGGQNDPYRSMIKSASADADDHALNSPQPPIVIFDGAPAFNNWRSHWHGSNWLVVLDRSSPSLPDGAAAINQAYATRICDSQALDGLQVPSAVDVVAYEEQR